MATRKKILFEGQDVSLSSTMQKLQDKAETASSKLLESYSKTGKKSKDLVELLKKEVESQERLAQLSSADKRYEAAEKYSRKIDEINKKEEEAQKRLDSQRLKPKEREEAEKKLSEGFEEQRSAAAVVRDDTVQKLKESLEEQKRTNQLLKQLLETDRVQWEEEVENDRKSVENFVRQTDKDGTDGMSIEEKAKYRYQKSLLEETEPQKRGGQSVLKDILGAGLIRDMGAMLGQMPNASDGYDMVAPMLRLAGAFSGAAIGAGVGAGAGALQTGTGGTGIGLGAIQGATLGGEMGSRAAEIAGNALSRFFTERENLESASLGYKALTGKNATASGVNQFGVSTAEATAIEGQMAMSSGGSKNDIRGFLGAQTGYGIDQGSLMGMVGSSRRTGGEFGKEIRNLLGTAEEEGIDRILFNDLVKGQTQLISSIGSMTEKVDPKNITALMMEMNDIGGGLSIKDPRSMGMIQSIDSGLKGGNDFNNAMDLTVLRKMKPEGSLLDLMEIKEQGLSSDDGREFLKGVLEQYKKMTGSEDQAVLALKGREGFGNLPIQVLRDLLNDSEKIDSMDPSKMKSEAAILEQENVSRRAIMRSEVTDAFAVGAIEGMSKINDQMAGLFKKAIDKALEDIKIGDAITKGIDSAKEAASDVIVDAVPDWMKRIVGRGVPVEK